MKRHWKSIIAALLVAALPAVAGARVVLYEDFEGGTLPPGFTAFSWQGSPLATVEDFGGNKVLKLPGSGVVSAGDPSWTDYTVSARVYVYEGSYSAYAAGLLFRGQGDFIGSGTADALVWQGRPGEMQLEKWIKDAWWQHLQNDYSHSFPPGEWHTLKIAVRGTHFDFFLDGVLASSYDDATAPLSGQVGLRNWMAGAYYDDLLVEVPDEPGVLLNEDFEYGNALQPAWAKSAQPTPDSGFVARIVDVGGQRALDLSGTGVVTIGDPAWIDYTAEADVFVYDPWYWAYAAGLMIHSQTPALSSWDAMDTTVWQGRSPGYYGPGLMQDEKWSSTTGWEWLYSQTGTAWTDGAWHRLKVIASGPYQRLFLDGVELGRTSNFYAASGYVGFRAYAVGSYFDNLLVRVNDTAAPTTTATVTPAGPGGWIVVPAEVALEAVDAATPAASGVREIRFALDGAAETTVPGGSAALMLGDGVHTVAYRAVDQDNNAEVASTLTASVDTTPPVVTVTTAPTSLRANGRHQRVTIGGSAVDATSGVASVTITVTDEDGDVVASPAGFGSTVSLLGRHGKSYTVTVVSTDVAGNTATATAVVPVH